VQLEDIGVQNVSRETFAALKTYEALVAQWNRRINLIASSTVPAIWDRHILDSAQLFPYLSPEDEVMDIGSGAGFPGLVLAILGCKYVHLIESDKRKSVFLQEASRLLNLDTRVCIHSERVEQVKPLSVGVVTSRACASVDNLLTYSYPHLKSSGKLLFLKGKQAEDEIAVASDWRFDYSVHPSKVGSEGVVLEIVHLERGV
jgi:16S rRNA (guanine527-N7)-methyltransferase